MSDARSSREGEDELHLAASGGYRKPANVEENSSDNLEELGIYAAVSDKPDSKQPIADGNSLLELETDWLGESAAVQLQPFQATETATRQGLVERLRDLGTSFSHVKQEIRMEKRKVEKLESSYSAGLEQATLRIRELEAEKHELKSRLQAAEATVQAANESAVRVKSESEKEMMERIQEKNKKVEAEYAKQETTHQTRLHEVTQKHQKAIANMRKEFNSKFEEHEKALIAQLRCKDQEVQLARQEALDVDKRLNAMLELEKSRIQEEQRERKKVKAQLDKVHQEHKAAMSKKEIHHKSLLREREEEFHCHTTYQESLSQTESKKKDDECAEKTEKLELEKKAVEKRLQSELDEKDRIVRMKEEEIKARDTTIQQKTAVLQGLHRQLGHLHGTLTAKSQVHPLNIHAKLSWKNCSPLPTAMAHPQVVVINGEVYAGGGETESDDTICQLFKYTPIYCKWSGPYICPVGYFGLGELSGKPVLVGGINVSTKEVTSDVHVIDGDKYSRTSYPMPTARSHLCVISLESHLVACGGSRAKSLLAVVEILKKDTQQWYKADPLSIPISRMLSATIDDFCFFMGGEKQAKFTSSTRTVMCASITALLRKAIPLEQTAEPDPKSTVWKQFQETQYKHSAPVAMGEMLLAVGGDSSDMASHLTKTQARDIKQAVYAFCPINKTWVHIADLPVSSTMSTAVALPSQEIMVIGGKDSNVKFSRAVYKGTIRTD